jgi:hypothetical protein
MSRKTVVVAVALALIAGTLIYNSPALKEARFINALVARNIDARGGAGAWEKVSSMRVTGEMDLGQEMVVPYVLEQKRPDKMCFQFEFDGEIATQCTHGDGGWKITPFLGRNTAEPMTEAELREMADSAEPYGLLYNYAERGSDVEYVGQEQVDGRDTHKLKVTLSRGGVRWLYLDAETALEVKMETTRIVTGRERRVATDYSDWREVDGLLIAHRQDTRTEGDEEAHFLTVERVTVNPPLDDDRFRRPALPQVCLGRPGHRALCRRGIVSPVGRE